MKIDVMRRRAQWDIVRGDDSALLDLADYAKELRAEVERLREMLHRDYDDAKKATRNVRCRCDAWRACQGIRDRAAALRGEEK